MSRSIVVIGAGVAGLAAAWCARRLGCRVTLVDRGIGASALGGGAVDGVPWEQLALAARRLQTRPVAGPLGPDVVAFSDALGAWTLPEAGAPMPCLATSAGRLRPARGYDRSMLDLASLAGRRVLLPRVPRAGWDADSLASALGSDPFARAHAITFEVTETPILLHDDERRCADGDLAARHDDDARLDWLAERLREAIARASSAIGAVLLGPWLGARAARAHALSQRLGLPVGEILVGVGSSAGLRFEAARARLVETMGALLVASRAVRVLPLDGGVEIAIEEGEPLRADAAVLAVGGVAGGGIVYDPPERAAAGDLPPSGATPFRLSLEAPVAFAQGDLPLGVVSSLHGPDLDTTAWPDGERAGVLELVGIRITNGKDAIAAEKSARILAAGDVVAGKARTLLQAVASGIEAGREAAASSLT